MKWASPSVSREIVRVIFAISLASIRLPISGVIPLNTSNGSRSSIKPSTDLLLNSS